MKHLVPIHVANYVGAPGSVQPGFKKFYLKNGYFKLYDGTNENDVVLDRPLDGFTPLVGTITAADSVLTALEKLQNAISTFGGITGSGTPNRIPKFFTSTTIGDSLIEDNGASIVVNRPNSFATPFRFDVNGTIYCDYGTSNVANVPSTLYVNMPFYNLPGGTPDAIIVKINGKALPANGTMTGYNVAVSGPENIGFYGDFDDTSALSEGMRINSRPLHTGNFINFVKYTGVIGNTVFRVNNAGNTTANSFIKIGGTNLQYLMADGSVSTGPSIPTIGTWGTLNYPTWVSGTPFVKMTAAGTFALDTTVYYPNSNPSGFITSAALSGYVPTSRTLTINGTTFDLTANRSWTIATSSSPLTTKGDLYTFSTVDTRLPVGTDGQILTANSSVPEGLSWQDNYADWTSTVKHIVKNNGLSGTITKGTAVYVTSSDGTNMLVGRASNTSEATSSKTMGLMQSDITTTGGTQTGFVITEGLLGGLNTATATAGDPVWLGVNGALIYGLANKPYAPAHLVFIGIVTKISAGNGEIFVKVQNGFELKEIHDVDLITNPPNNGDSLLYNKTTTLWENRSEEFRLRQVSRVLSSDFIGLATQAIQPFSSGTYLSGAITVAPYFNGTNPGMLRISSSATPSSGGFFTTNSLSIGNIFPIVGMQMDLVFRTPNTIIGIGSTIRAGFMVVTNTATDASNGFYMEIVDNQLYGKTANASVRSQTGTFFPISNGGLWFHMRVLYKATNLIEYSLYDMAGVLLWSDTLTTNIPTALLTGSTLAFSSSTTTISTEMITVDYLGFTIIASTRGALN